MGRDVCDNIPQSRMADLKADFVFPEYSVVGPSGVVLGEAKKIKSDSVSGKLQVLPSRTFQVTELGQGLCCHLPPNSRESGRHSPGGWAGSGRPASSSCGRLHTHHPPWRAQLAGQCQSQLHLLWWLPWGKPEVISRAQIGQIGKDYRVLG